MTDEQREQARRAQAAYVEFLRWCVEYARRDKGLPSSTTADLEQDFAAFHGLTGENDFSLYQDFRAFLTDGKRAEFDKRRDDVCKAYHEQGIDAAVQRLEDEARYVEGFDFGTNSLEEIKQGIIQVVKEEHERTRQETGDAGREVMEAVKSEADKQAGNTARALDSLKQGQEEIKQGQGALLKGQAEHEDFLISLGTDLDEIKRNTRTAAPRSWDKQVSQPMAAQMLTDMGYSVSARQIQNWDRYIRTNGTKGTQPPEGYKIELRYHYETFKAWAELAAGNKRMKQGLRSRYQRVHKTNG